MRADLKTYFPPFEWGQDYTQKDFRGDLTAGITVGVMLIPQGMAYALIAGLPPIYGLYASFVPLILYGVLGTARQLSVGPMALISLLVAAGVAPLADGDMSRYISLSLVLAFMVGAIQLIMGLARFGFLANFLSYPVLSGFTSAAALIIAFTQLTHLLGVDLPNSMYIYELVWSAVHQADEIHFLTVTIGLLSITFLLVLQGWKEKLPGALIAVVATTVVVGILDLHEQGVEIVGDVPSGLPMPIVPLAGIEDLRELLPVAVVIALIGFMGSIAVAKYYASRHRYDVDANQELIALGAAGMAGSFFHAFPISGSLSRTAVNERAGARTTAANIVTAGVIGLTLYLLTPLFYYMPNAVLAAIVIVAVIDLVDVREAIFLWKTNRHDLGLMGLTFLTTIVLGIEEGVLIGVIASLIHVLYQSSHPHTVVMGRLPESTTYRNVLQFPEALVREGVAIVRIDSTIYFANVAHLKDTLRSLRDNSDPPLNAIIIDMYPVNDLDSTAIHALSDIVDELRQAGISVYLAGVKGLVREAMERAELTSFIGEDHFFLEVHDAVRAAVKEEDIGSEMKADIPQKE